MDWVSLVPRKNVVWSAKYSTTGGHRYYVLGKESSRPHTALSTNSRLGEQQKPVSPTLPVGSKPVSRARSAPARCVKIRSGKANQEKTIPTNLVRPKVSSRHGRLTTDNEGVFSAQDFQSRSLWSTANRQKQKLSDNEHVTPSESGFLLAVQIQNREHQHREKSNFEQGDSALSNQSASVKRLSRGSIPHSPLSSSSYQDSEIQQSSTGATSSLDLAFANEVWYKKLGKRKTSKTRQQTQSKPKQNNDPLLAIDYLNRSTASSRARDWKSYPPSTQGAFPAKKKLPISKSDKALGVKVHQSHDKHKSNTEKRKYPLLSSKPAKKSEATHSLSGIIRLMKGEFVVDSES